MPTFRRTVQVLGLLVVTSALLLAAREKELRHTAAQMDDNKKIVHALNRFTFGIRAGDVERVRAMGLNKWFEEQLHPEKINDSALEARLAPLRTLKMNTREMVENFPPPLVLKAVENGRFPMPRDPAKRAIYETRIAELQQRQQNKSNAQTANGKYPPAGAPDMKEDMKADMKMDPDAPSLTPEQRRQKQDQVEDAMSTSSDIGRLELLRMPPEQRYQKILAMSSDERVELARQYRGGRALRLVDGMKPEQQETVEAMVAPQIVIVGEVSQAKLLRAIYSDRQLDEVMTDFWFNHFNVFIGKGLDRYMLSEYERDVIRPHALGKFKDLLVATAKSPAMLFYLDNWQSIGPDSDFARYGPQQRQPRFRRRRFGEMPTPRRQQQRPQQGRNRPKGLNENYAREIMELHTLGVDGGYTQKDVTELAKVLTGWTIRQPLRGGGFVFNPRAHEPGTKYVLGHKIKEHGEAEGMQMLDILAHHPSTARFISRKLAMRFVSDNPPQSLVDRMAQTFLKKDGDIREVLRTMFNSPEFWSADAYRAKVKTPLEFVASAVRASGVDVHNALPLVQFMNRMGMPLYGMQPPTGYSMKASAWVNSSALLNRMNFALALGTGRLPGASLDPQTLLQGAKPADAESALADLERDLLAGDVSPQTHSVLLKQLGDPQVTRRRLDDPARPPNVGAIAGLIMGSPEFQRR
jgi:uncharacterized protein (DUF1800 family)